MTNEILDLNTAIDSALRQFYDGYYFDQIKECDLFTSNGNSSKHNKQFWELLNKSIDTSKVVESITNGISHLYEIAYQIDLLKGIIDSSIDKFKSIPKSEILYLITISDLIYTSLNKQDLTNFKGSNFSSPGIRALNSILKKFENDKTSDKIDDEYTVKEILNVFRLSIDLEILKEIQRKIIHERHYLFLKDSINITTYSENEIPFHEVGKIKQEIKRRINAKVNLIKANTKKIEHAQKVDDKLLNRSKSQAINFYFKNLNLLDGYDYLKPVLNIKGIDEKLSLSTITKFVSALLGIACLQNGRLIKSNIEIAKTKIDNFKSNVLQRPFDEEYFFEVISKCYFEDDFISLKSEIFIEIDLIKFLLPEFELNAHSINNFQKIFKWISNSDMGIFFKLIGNKFYFFPQAIFYETNLSQFLEDKIRQTIYSDKSINGKIEKDKEENILGELAKKFEDFYKFEFWVNKKIRTKGNFYKNEIELDLIVYSKVDNHIILIELKTNSKSRFNSKGESDWVKNQIISKEIDGPEFDKKAYNQLLNSDNFFNTDFGLSELEKIIGNSLENTKVSYLIITDNFFIDKRTLSIREDLEAVVVSAFELGILLDHSNGEILKSIGINESWTCNREQTIDWLLEQLFSNQIWRSFFKQLKCKPRLIRTHRLTYKFGYKEYRCLDIVSPY
jgi:hypothetical protein